MNQSPSPEFSSTYQPTRPPRMLPFPIAEIEQVTSDRNRLADFRAQVQPDSAWQAFAESVRPLPDSL